MTRRTLVHLPIALVGALAAGLASAQAPASIDRLGWLAGCWAGERGERRFEEHWMAPRGGAMLGMGRTVRGEALAEYEHLLIREEAGVLVFTAKPSRQPQASFPAVSGGEGEIAFENPAHDFPQRVSYRRQADGGLLARIEGQQGGKARAVEFPMRRVACPAGAP
jgi:hypothetical protein